MPGGKLDGRFRRWGHFWPAYQLFDLLGRNNEMDALVFVSDGGHHDNLGLGALVDRECERIVCVDASADPEYTCEDLADVLRMLEIDGQWRFELELEGKPSRFGAACKALREGRGPLRIYASRAGSPGLTILYCKAALSTKSPLSVEHYAARNPTFPHESTADQFFDEAQFEAYLQLGQKMADSIVQFIAEGRASTPNPPPSTNEGRTDDLEVAGMSADH